jgi:hypothetical protein
MDAAKSRKIRQGIGLKKMVNELGINGSKNIEKKRCTAELTAYEKKQRIN